MSIMAAIGAVVQRSGWCPALAGVRAPNLRQLQLHQMCACCVTSPPAASALAAKEETDITPWSSPDEYEENQQELDISRCPTF